MEGKLVLVYWDIRGLAERIRLLLEYLGLPYEDRRLTDRNEWMNVIKPSINDPFINLPYLQDGDKFISESEAIIVHIILKANRGDLLGKDNCQRVEVTKLRGAFGDLYGAYVGTIYGSGDLNTVKPGLLDRIRNHLGRFQKYLNGREYLCGDLTYMDILLADFVDVLERFEPGFVKTNFQGLYAVHERVWGLPAIAAYRDSRFKAMPCNGPSAIWGGKA